MSRFAEHLVVIRGGGDIGSGVTWRLRRAGFPVVVLELPRPLTVRRTVAFSTAVSTDRVTIDGVDGVRANTPSEAAALAAEGVVPVVVSDVVPTFPHPVSVIVDARLAKRPLDTTLDQAPLVVGLGPGFTAGTNCHCVVETLRGHRLGRVMWNGSAASDTRVPGEIGGASTDRILRAPTTGTLDWSVDFGDVVGSGAVLGHVDGQPVTAAIAGTVRGLISNGAVDAGLKIGDIDPRMDPFAIDQISDKALAVGGGVLEAVLTWLDSTPC